MMSRHFRHELRTWWSHSQKTPTCQKSAFCARQFLQSIRYRKCVYTIYIYTVEPAITATLYNGHLSIAITNEQSRPKFHNIEPVYSGHLLNAACGHPFVVPD